jgi:hypothetical protein
MPKKKKKGKGDKKKKVKKKDQEVYISNVSQVNYLGVESSGGMGWKGLHLCPFQCNGII